MTPLTPKEQELIMRMLESGVSFGSQGIFKSRHAFCRSMERLKSRDPSIIKAKKIPLNEARTCFRISYSLTVDGRFLARAYLIPARESDKDV